MARKFTVADLVLRCQQVTDLENSEFIQPAEWRGLIGTQYAELWGIVTQADGLYFKTSETVTAAGTDTEGAFDLPASHMTTVGVDYVVDANGRKRQLDELMIGERNLYSTTRATSYAWQLSGQSLILFPPPISGQQYIHHYVPQPPDMVAAHDTHQVDVVTPDGEGFLIWGVAVRALAKQGSDARLAQQEREEARARLMDWATLRSLATMKRQVVLDDAEDRYMDPADWRWSR